MAHKLSYNFS